MVDVNDDVTQIEKVYTQDETPLYRTKALLLEFMPEWSKVAIELGKPVPVLGQGKARIGTASLAREGNRVYAELVIDYATDDRLDLENGKELYAAPLVKFTQEVEIFQGSNLWMPTVVEIGNVQIIDRKLFSGMVPIGSTLE